MTRRLYGLIHVVEDDETGDKPEPEPTVLH